jgi:3-hydroxyanthranilate 3,4-dioxygenase
MNPLAPINVPEWIDEHRHLLKPPVGNRQVFPTGGDFIVMVVGGPNQRTDFHVDPYEEVFHQVEGHMHVDVQTPAGRSRVDIGPGDMWVLPRGMPHSPQRPEAGSIGLVVERVREPGTREAFRWYCETCNAIVHEAELQVSDIVADLPPVFDAFYASAAARTCPACGALHRGRA